MTKIEIDPELPNNFVEMDWADYERDPKAFSDTITGHYEGGKIVILRDSPIKADYGLLNHISLPQGQSYKKIRDDYFTEPKLSLESFRLHSYLISHHPAKYLAACREIKRVSDISRTVAKQLFPSYRFTKMPCSWRFTPTGPEHMHIDHFGALGEEQEKWYLRIFFNFDLEPRIWHVSHTLSGLAERYYDQAGMAKWRQGRGCDFSREIGHWAFGGMENTSQDQGPRHKIAWETGDVWILDSRLHSHQVIWGRRVMVTGFEVDPASMLWPEKSLDGRVRAFHQRYGPEERLAG